MIYRYVTLPEPCTLDREELLDLYHKHVIPLPQRKYRSNRRGQEMTKKQILLAKKRKVTFSDDEEPSFKKRHSSETAPDAPLPRFMVSANLSSSSTEKTDPPKSMINFDRKIIKLNSGKEKSSSSESGSNRITFSQSSESKSVKLKRPSVDAATTVSTVSSSRTVKLSNTSSSSVISTKEGNGESVTKPENEKVNEEPENLPKKKIKRISWP